MEGKTRENDALLQLHRWLGYEVKSAWLMGLLFLLPIGPVIMLLKFLMLVFIPVLLVQLYRARWLGTLATFVIMMSAGFAIPGALNLDPNMMLLANALSIFVPFYFFCWVLKWVVSDRVREMRELRKMRAMDHVEGR